MSAHVLAPLGPNSHCQEAVLRISETLSACRQPEELTEILAEQLDEVLPFDYLEIVAFKENSKDIEWRGWGKRPAGFSNVVLTDPPNRRTTNMERLQYPGTAPYR
jgi:hypothetical protein